MVHGQLSKLEKSRHPQIFLNPTHPDDNNIGVLVATSSVGNVGIDSPGMRNVFRRKLPPYPLDFVQDSSRAVRVYPLVPGTYLNILYIFIKNILYIFERSCDPDEDSIDNLFCQEVVDDLFQMAKILVLAPTFYSVDNKLMCGYPYVDNDHVNNSDCGICHFSRKDQIFPLLWWTGVEEMIFNIFYHDRNDDTITEEIEP